MSSLHLCMVSCASNHCGSGSPVRIDRGADGLALPVYTFGDTSRVVFVSDRGLEPFSGSGQIVLVGSMGLTAAHTLPRYRGLRETSEMILPGMERVRFEVLESGPGPGGSVVLPIEMPKVEFGEGSTDPMVKDFLRQMQVVDEESARSMKHIRSFEAIAGDWALLRLDPSAAEGGAAFEIETGTIAPGTCVSVFRSSVDGRELWRLELPVVEIEFESPDIPTSTDGIVTLWNPRRVETDGWSGGFVGRQDESGQWRLIGVLSASSIENRLIFVTRPPVEMLEWFAGGGIGEPPISASESPRTQAGGS